MQSIPTTSRFIHISAKKKSPAFLVKVGKFFSLYNTATFRHNLSLMPQGHRRRIELEKTRQRSSRRILSPNQARRPLPCLLIQCSRRSHPSQDYVIYSILKCITKLLLCATKLRLVKVMDVPIGVHNNLNVPYLPVCGRCTDMR